MSPVHAELGTLLLALDALVLQLQGGICDQGPGPSARNRVTLAAIGLERETAADLTI